MRLDLIKYINKINRKAMVPKRLLDLFIAQGSSTIPELSKAAGVSLPTATSALNELMSMGLAREIGKKDNATGRIPMVYDLVPTAGYFIGANPEMDCLALAASDFCGNLIVEKTRVPYRYENTPENLEQLGSIINDFIDTLPIKRDDILNVCVNVAERVNPFEGRAYNMFTFTDIPLTIIDGKLYYGQSGYSGEFGHMPGYNNDIICHCGKIGCVETEVSGRALKRKLTEQLLAGKQSILSDKVVNRKEELTLQDILDAIAKEDVLSLATLQKVADELGKQLAGVINIFNPEMLVIGGEMSATGDYITLPVNMGIKKFSLNIMNEDSKIVTSTLKGKAGVLGACLMARHRLMTIQP